MGKTALIIDNDFFFVEFLAEILDQRGWQILKAYSGREGIAWLIQRPVDLVFVDLVMPRLDGRQVIRFLRSRFPDHPFPVIAVSGTLIEKSDDVISYGADYYLAKGPLDVMGTAIQHLLDGMAAGPNPLAGAPRVLEPGPLYPRQSTAQLMDSLEFQDAVLSSLGVGVIVIEKDARILNITDLALEITGRRLDEVLTMPVTQLFAPADHGRLIQAMKQTARHPDIRKTGLRLTLQGRPVYGVVSRLLLGGNMTGWVMTLETLRSRSIAARVSDAGDG